MDISPWERGFWLIRSVVVQVSCNCHILSPYCLLFSGGASFIRVKVELQLESDVNVQLMHLYHLRRPVDHHV